MSQCRNCDHELDPSFAYCPHCGASVGKVDTDLEQRVRALLDQGQKIAAVKLYKEHTGVGLADAKTAVEALQAAPGTTSPPAPRDDLEAELLRLLGRGDKLGAVKLYRDRHGVALLEAKQAVEALAAKHGLVTPRGGCLGLVLAALFVLYQACFAE